MTSTSCSSCGLERDSVALVLQGLDCPSPDAIGVTTVTVSGARFLIDGIAGQEVVRGDEHRMRDGDDRLLVTAMTEDASIAGAKGTVASADGREGRLDQSGAEPP